jgi:hypothetical protein
MTVLAYRTQILEQRAAGVRWRDIALQYNVTVTGLRGMASKYGWTKNKVRSADEPPISIPTSSLPPVESALNIPDANALVIGDLHIPYHNRTMLERAIQVARRHSIRRVIIGGDLFDFASLSHHPHNAPEQDPSATIRLAGDVLRALLAHFDEAYICNGNHDERFAKRLDRAWDLQLLINAAMGRDWPACSVSVTNLDYVYLGDNWIVGHPSSYSGQGGKTPADLADLYQRNVVTLHNHVIGMAQSKSGKYIGVDCGHMTEAGQHYYQARRLSKFARWNAGFMVVSNGYPYTYSEQFTDWSLLSG